LATLIISRSHIIESWTPILSRRIQSGVNESHRWFTRLSTNRIHQGDNRREGRSSAGSTKDRILGSTNENLIEDSNQTLIDNRKKEKQQFKY
jgi:hypothetical protein